MEQMEGRGASATDAHLQHPADPFTELPVEACWQVLSFLPPQTVALCCLVSTQWNAICNDEAFWKNLYIKSAFALSIDADITTAGDSSWKQRCLALTLNFGESSIVDREYRHVLVSWLGSRESRWVLHYKGTRDGFSLANFHKFNDSIGPSLCIVLSKKQCIFGGYTPYSWMTLRNEDEKGCIYRSEATIEAEDQDLEGSEDGDTESGKTEGSNGEDSDSEAETDANSGEKEEDSTDSDERIKAKRKPVAVSKEDQEKLETKRARMRRRARDEHLVAQKHLPTEPFIYTLRNLWDKPPTQMFPKRPGDKNGVLVHEYYGALWGSGFDLGLIGHPSETPPTAWCRIGATYASPYPPGETGGTWHYLLGGDPRDFEISELEVFVLKEEEDKWREAGSAQGGPTANEKRS